MEIAKLFLQLGVAGAALFIVYHLINKIFKYLDSKNVCDNSANGMINRLCEKIDKMCDLLYQSTNETSTMSSVMASQFNMIITRFDAMESRHQKETSDMFTALREHEANSNERLQNMHFDMSGGLGKLESSVENLVENCKMKEVSK